MANLTLEDIANISFPRANFGGYRAEDVDAFIDDVQVSYDNVLKESAELKRKLAILAQKVEEYRNEEDRHPQYPFKRSEAGRRLSAGSQA